MPYKPSHVANAFLNRARAEGFSVDQLKIQKLVYFQHGWFLATRNAPAVGDLFEAWPYGPVLSSLYQEFKANGSSPIQGWATDIDPLTGDNKALMVNLSDRYFYDVFDQVWNRYKGYSGLYLSNLTHAPGTPWSKARERGATYLKNEEIKEHFIEIANK
ncbi:Panacea domain-containing protein [Terrihabitans sp. B22-R8]|uniref:Panacea domain-containing protein n=1 Tax=Terrihabitans sp. B22-R8 TaxID=3425128 RepID=UPI00403C3843